MPRSTCVSALPAIRVPTLVIHQTGDPAVPIGHGRYLADHIAGACAIWTSTFGRAYTPASASWWTTRWPESR